MDRKVLNWMSGKHWRGVLTVISNDGDDGGSEMEEDYDDEDYGCWCCMCFSYIPISAAMIFDFFLLYQFIYNLYTNY